MNFKPQIHHTNSNPPPPPVPAEKKAEVDQIRDILFGKDLHRVDDRFKHLERLEAENQAHQARLEKRVEDFEALLKKRLDEALEELAKERQARETGDKLATETFARKTRDMQNNLSHCFADLARKLEAAPPPPPPAPKV